MLFHPHTCWWLKLTDTCVRKTNNAAGENLAVVVLANSGKTPEISKFFPSNKCVCTNCTLFFHVLVSWFLGARYVVLAPVAFLLMTPPCWNSPPCSWCVCTCTSADQTPVHKGESGPPEPRDSEDPSVLPLLTRTICCCVFFLPRVSSFLVFFLSSCLFSPAPLPVWVMAIVHNFVSGYGGALHVCDVGARGSVLQRP